MAPSHLIEVGAQFGNQLDGLGVFAERDELEVEQACPPGTLQDPRVADQFVFLWIIGATKLKLPLVADGLVEHLPESVEALGTSASVEHVGGQVQVVVAVATEFARSDGLENVLKSLVLLHGPEFSRKASDPQARFWQAYGRFVGLVGTVMRPIHRSGIKFCSFCTMNAMNRQITDRLPACYPLRG